VNGGTLVASNASALAGGDVSVNAGTLNLSSISESVRMVTLGNGTVTGSGILTQASFTATNSGQALVSESLSGTGGFTQIGAGTTTLSGSNSFIGGVTLSAGKLIASNSYALGSTNGFVSVSGGTLDLGGLAQRIGSTTLSSGSIGNGTLTASSAVMVTGNSNSTISATLAGIGGLTKSGSGTLNLASALPSGSLRIAAGTLLSDSSVVGSLTNTTTTLSISNGAIWRNSGQLTVGAVSNATATLSIASGGSLIATNGLTIARDGGSRGTVTLGDSNGSANTSLGASTISFGSGNGTLQFAQRGDMTISNAIVGKGTISSTGIGETTLSGNQSGFTGTNYLSSGKVVLGSGVTNGGTLNIAGRGTNVVFEMKSGSVLSSTGTHAVAGLLSDNSGKAFKDSIKGQVVLAEGGTLNKTYANTSVAGFGAGIGAGKSFSLLAGSVAGSATLTAKVTSGALDFKGTYSNAIVMSITDPSFSSIRNTIQWYDPGTKTWKNTIAGNTGNKPAAIIGMNGKSFAGSFSTFLLQAKTAGILTAAEDTLAEINAMTSTQINTTLAKIMGAFGYDTTTKSSWAVINHNSLYSGEDLGSSAIFDEAALNHTLSDPGIVSSDLNPPVITAQAVPEPGTWALMVSGGLVLLLVARAKRRKMV
jgi:autotransporter-associated beta strand protein